MFFLGFSAGLPYLLVFSTLTVWLAEAGVSRSAIGFFGWVGMTFSIKMLWAPVIDQLPIPWFTKKLGRRRSWMLAAQIFIVLALLLMAFIHPAENLVLFAFAAVLVAFGSATQDISIDAFRIESAASEYQGEMAATYIFGYRVALLVSGAGALYIAEASNWTVSYLAMAALMGVGIITALFVKEPENSAQRQNNCKVAWLKNAFVEPFTDFFHRQAPYAILILMLIGLYKVSDITMGIMANPFYLDLGFSKL
ncbi:MAG TPA: AmpG family muropeptide MFS transporter, partial [Gammaproteobacteria bacterium]|nr:AmpG family muropeptide MFS transporter [Gammaproteobacteria bacterium]